MIQTSTQTSGYRFKTLLEPHLKHKNHYLNVEQQIHAELCQFMGNVRYLVKLRFKSYAAFQRALYSTHLIKISLQTVRGYETGFFRTVTYNWLFAIAHFLLVDVHEMLTTDFSERDKAK